MWNNCKCAYCSNSLTDPVQLSRCLHILCSPCVTLLEQDNNTSFICPQCKIENIKPSTLRRISGISDSVGSIIPCDVCSTGNRAVWNCFHCAKNLCSACRAQHPVDHVLLLLQRVHDVKEPIFGTKIDKAGTETLPKDGVDSHNLACPICHENKCQHIQLLQSIRSAPLQDMDRCPQEGHVDCNGGKQVLKYFCEECLIPVCGDCSERGLHKLHRTNDAVNMIGYITEWRRRLAERASMLALRYKTAEEDVERMEERLEHHISDISFEMNGRKMKILEGIMTEFEQALHNVEAQGVDILNDLREKLNETQEYGKFLLEVLTALKNETLVAGTLDTLNYVKSFRSQAESSILLDDLEKHEFSKPDERRLVLPEMMNPTPAASPLARVGTEWHPLKLQFTIPLHHDVTIAHSIVAPGGKKCLLSCSMTRANNRDAVIHHCDKQEPLIYNIPQGEYYIAQRKSKEILASYTKGEHHLLQYCDGNIFYKETPDQSDLVEFREIRRFDFRLTSIVATKDNNILGCFSPDKKQESSYLMLMSPQGKELFSTTDVKMISPDYVAANDNGEICISDKTGGAVIVLDNNLKVTDIVKYPFSTGTEDSEVKFNPHGLCYDSYGRIIVADPNNHTVLILTRDIQTHQYKMKPLLMKSNTSSDKMNLFSFPKLVAMSPDSRLWVVCREDIFVFDYCP